MHMHMIYYGPHMRAPDNVHIGDQCMIVFVIIANSTWQYVANITSMPRQSFKNFKHNVDIIDL